MLHPKFLLLHLLLLCSNLWILGLHLCSLPSLISEVSWLLSMLHLLLVEWVSPLGDGVVIHLVKEVLCFVAQGHGGYSGLFSLAHCHASPHHLLVWILLLSIEEWIFSWLLVFMLTQFKALFLLVVLNIFVKIFVAFLISWGLTELLLIRFTQVRLLFQFLIYNYFRLLFSIPLKIWFGD